MKTLNQATNRELEVEQVRRCIARANAEILRITTEVLPRMMIKQAARRAELDRQLDLAQAEVQL